ncbi:MAG TPA: hypothetical protein VGC77_00770 [Rhodopseudomonas sp.]|uniref:hypothetical protein n=1 Tax=Rhodopseudomonas sp. TaxID=1078 RepID=UPI002EDAC153
MLQFLLRTRAGNPFRARSAARDVETDTARIASIALSIDEAIRAAEAENEGLNRRLADVVARAAVTFGNDTHEYQERDLLDSHHQNLFNAEIANAERRLAELVESIGHFKFLKAVLTTRFPDLKPSASPAGPGDAPR